MNKLLRLFLPIFLLTSCGPAAPAYTPPTAIVYRSTTVQTPDLSGLVKSGPQVDADLEEIITTMLYNPTENVPTNILRHIPMVTVDVSDGKVIFTHKGFTNFSSPDEIDEFGRTLIYFAAKSPEVYYMVNEEYTELSEIRVIFTDPGGNAEMYITGRTNIHRAADNATMIKGLVQYIFPK